MALIHCPECGGTVSDQAPACVHCGCPLAFDVDHQRYALVLLDAGPDPEATVRLLAKQEGRPLEEVRDQIAALPGVLYHDLERKEAKEAAAELGAQAGVKVVLEENAGSLSQAVTAPAVTFRTPAKALEKITFGTLVGVVVAGNLISFGILWLLVIFF